MSDLATGIRAVARINGVPLNSPDESPSDDELRQRACTELLRRHNTKVCLQTTMPMRLTA